MDVFNCNGDLCIISKWIVFSVPAVVFVLLVTILILSVCLCRVCKRAKKQKVTEDVALAAENLDEAALHYAELQCLPGSNRGQCDGGPCPALAAAQNTDYATLAELKGPEDDCCTQEQKEDADEAMIEDVLLVKEE